MKKIYTLAIICIVAAHLSSAQTSEHTIILDVNMDYMADMIPTSSGDFVVVAKQNYMYSVAILLISSQGEILWNRSYYGDILSNARIYEKANGNIIIPMGIYYPHLMEINQSGDSIRSITINDHEGALFGSVIELPDSKLMATELIFNNDPYWPAVIGSRFVKLSPEMDIIEKYPVQNFEFRDMIPQSDSTLITVVFTVNHSTNFAILQYSFAPQQLAWTNCPEFNPDLHKIIRLNDEYLAAIGRTDHARSSQAVLMKIDNAVNQVLCNTYPNWSFYDITCDETSEKIYTLGSENSQSNINTIDYSGNLLSMYPMSDTLTCNTILYKDNYLYLTASFGEPYPNNSCFIKIHKDSILSINEVMTNARINVYPNPARDYVFFELPAMSPLAHPNGGRLPTLKIQNTIGQEVARISIKSEMTVWDCRGMKPGIYFYNYSSSAGEIIGKVILSK